MIEVPIGYVQPGDIVGKAQTFKKHSGGMSSTVDLRKGYKLSARVLEKLRQAYEVQHLCILDPNDPDSTFEEGFDEVARQKIANSFIENLNTIQSSSIIDMKQLGAAVKDIIENVSRSIRNGMGSFRSLSKVFYEVQSHDIYTWEHSVNTAIYVAIIGLSVPSILNEKQQRLSPAAFSKVEILVFNMLLHDIGKIRVPVRILNKQEPLSAAEWQVVAKHPYSGFVYLRKINEQIELRHMPTIPAYFMRACLFHHQAYDGTGYPAMRTKEDELNPLVGDNISVVGRIAAVADMYDALSSERPYRRSYHPADALTMLREERNKKLDPRIVDIFVKRIAPYPRGTTVVLSTGELAVVVGHVDGNGFHPIVRPYMRRIRKGGKQRVLRLPPRDPIEIVPGSKVGIVLNKELYEVRA